MSIATASMTFKNASQTFKTLNPHLGLLPHEKRLLSGNSERSTGMVVRQRGFQNKTEAEYALILEAMKRRGDILRYEYEGVTLRWQGIRYTPDFVVFPLIIAVHHPIKLIEVKGAFTKGKYERAIERFRHARTYWPEFSFEMHQKTKDGWKQIS